MNKHLNEVKKLVVELREEIQECVHLKAEANELDKLYHHGRYEALNECIEVIRFCNYDVQKSIDKLDDYTDRVYHEIKETTNEKEKEYLMGIKSGYSVGAWNLNEILWGDYK